MTAQPSAPIRAPIPDAAGLDYARALMIGLQHPQKYIPSRFLYDAAGSELFEQITELPEYYPTRTEIEILRAHRPELVGLVEGRVLIEPGSGSSRKTELLLDAGRLPRAYVAIDVSPDALDGAARRLARHWPGLTVVTVVGGFETPVRLPAALLPHPRIAFFPGSTIGNLSRAEAQRLLAHMLDTTASGTMIVGVDLPKSRKIMEPAYNDAAEVTARFNLNLLTRANREAGATFDLEGWRHIATWDEQRTRIDMWLESRRRQSVSVMGRTVTFSAGERIHTEASRKYRSADFISLAAGAGWRSQAVWTDTRALFSVHVLSAAGA